VFPLRFDRIILFSLGVNTMRQGETGIQVEARLCCISTRRCAVPTVTSKTSTIHIGDASLLQTEVGNRMR